MDLIAQTTSITRMTVVRTHPAEVRKLVTLPGVADTDGFLMHTGNTLPESYQQVVNNNTLATIKRQVQQRENATPVVAISVETAHGENHIFLEYLASELPLEEPEIRSTDPNIPIDNNCPDNELHFAIPWGSRDYKDGGDESDICNPIPAASRGQLHTNAHKRFVLATSDVKGYEGEDADDVDPDEDDEASQADDVSTESVEN